MTTIDVNVSSGRAEPYTIYLGCSLNDTLPSLVSSLESERRVSRIVWIMDDRFSASIPQSLCPSHPHDLITVCGSEETVKTRKSRDWLEDKLLSLRCDRNVLLVALGGGSIGDLVGLVAASYMRGVRFIHVPTTLLAIVDASIGGKTAINTPFAKNSIGAFHQPSGVICDFSFLQSLSDRDWRNGMAEIIKAGFVGDSTLFNALKKFSGINEFRNQLTNGQIPNPALEIIQLAIDYKRRIVEGDEKDNGIRNELNFGHTIGHALERLSNCSFTHGECVSLGMVYELLCLRAVKFLESPEDITTLIGLLTKFQLPTFIPPKLLDQHHFEEFQKFLQMDKKVAKIDGKSSPPTVPMVPIVALRSRGHAVGKSRTIGVPANIVKRVVSPYVMVNPKGVSIKPTSRVQLPGSKSLANRALLLAALVGREGFVLSNVPCSVDVQIMIDALNQFGTPLASKTSSSNLITVNGPLRIEHPNVSVFIGNSGTTSRFLLPVAAFLLSQSSVGESVTFTCDPRMTDRPIMDLIKPLMNLFNNLRIVFADKKGFFPFTIERIGGNNNSSDEGLSSIGQLSVDSSLSSQFVSGLLMMLCFLYPNAINLEVAGLKENGEATSQPFIDMTVKMIRIFGGNIENFSNNCYACMSRQEVGEEEAGAKSITNYSIPGDASAATYPLAIAALTGTEVSVNIGPDGLQADYQFVDLLTELGCSAHVDETSSSWTTIKGPSGPLHLPTENAIINMSNLTDTFLTASVLFAKASQAFEPPNSYCAIADVANQRIKECDRIYAMASNLNMCGFNVCETEDGLRFHPSSPSTVTTHPILTASYDDHRVAMSMAVLATVCPNILIENPRCVEKTFPNFWDVLENDMGIEIVGCPMPVSASAYDHLVILVGMRGIGKSTIGSSVASNIGSKFIDLDTVISEFHQQDLDDLIGDIGWEKFRQVEYQFLKKVIMESTRNEVKTIISTGGGIVEFAPSRHLISSIRNVVWIRTLDDEQTIERAITATEKLRSALYDPREMYARRKPWYGECSWYNLFTDNLLPEVSVEIAEKMINRLWSPETTTDITKISSFVCLTGSSYSGWTESDFKNAIGHTKSAVEIRLDKLDSIEKFMVSYNQIRRTMGSVPTLILTLRTVYEGGSFDGDYLEMIQSLLRLNPECLDIEVREKETVEWISDNLRNYPNVKFIASRHFSTSVPQSDVELVSDISAVISPYWASVGKVVYHASTVSENARLHVVSQEQSKIFQKPCIAVCTGSKGLVSRLLNPVMTPVCSKDPRLPRAAFGQLTSDQNENLQSGLVGTVRKNFHLFGSPIDKSPSPYMHNLMFACRGLGSLCDYSPITTEAIGEVVQIVEGNPSFRGASVTIPLKERVYEYCVEREHQLSEDAQLAKAVNTLTRTPTGGIRGDNTDIIALRKILNRLTAVNETPVVIVGTGGAARAALVAAKSTPHCNPIFVYGRDEEKVDVLCAEFSVLPWDGGSSRPGIVISCVPGMTQDGILETDPSLVTNSSFLIEMAYIPRITPFSRVAKSTVFGSEILVLQGIEQHKFWVDALIGLGEIPEPVNLAFLRKPIDPSFIENQISAQFTEEK